MKKLLSLFFVVALSLSLVACAPKTDKNEPIVPATIVLGVDNEDMGIALQDAWNQKYTEETGITLEYRKIDAAGAAGNVEINQAEEADIILAIGGEVIGRQHNFAVIEDELAKKVEDYLQETEHNNINSEMFVYLPAFYDGMAFAWNATLLEEAGFDITDANEDGLPDSLDTWEEIFAAEWDLTGEVKEVFPISLDEPWSAYSSLTSGGFKIFEKGTDKPGYDSEEFLAGLEFIKEFSKQGINLDETGVKKSGADMGWRWDAMLEGKYYFGLLGTWMDIDGKEAELGQDIRISKMPTFNGTQLSPFVKTKGFVVNGYSKNVKQAMKVLDWLYTPEGQQTIVDNSSYLPTHKADAPFMPEVDSENGRQMAKGLAVNYPEPAGTLPNNPEKPAMDGYYGLTIQDWYKAVWDGEKTPEEAQAEIIDAYANWLAENNQ